MESLVGVGSIFPVELPTDPSPGQLGNFNDYMGSPAVGMMNRFDGPFLGGANDFPGSAQAGTHELFTPSAQDCALNLSEAHSQPQGSHTTPAQPPNATNAYRPLPHNTISRIPDLPTLTLQTDGFQGRSIPSSRRQSWQSGRSSAVQSQFTGTTPSSGYLSTPFSSIQSSFDTPHSSHPPSGLNPSSASFGRSANLWSSESAVSYKQNDNYALSPEPSRMTGFRSFGEMPSYLDFFPDTSPFNANPSPTTTGANAQQPPTNRAETLAPPPLRILAPTPHSSAPPAPTRPPQAPTQHHQQQHLTSSTSSSSPPHDPSATLNSDAPTTTSPTAPPPLHTPTPTPKKTPTPNPFCPRCNRRFTSKPRDLGRNIRRHLSLACPAQRDVGADADGQNGQSDGQYVAHVQRPPRLPCSFHGVCGKTFARDCARRVHERRQHGAVVGRVVARERERGGLRGGAGAGAGVGGRRGGGGVGFVDG
ncbi:uncharacterized protein BKCO1_1400093 [Diplodia corticola]|uniref:C2H2-type domain-containing protein n=1 Tax=Diplodia corticola TaxID=236234 RepID=A0A1J9R5X6_9PEZI|nr:uncharacterized protein BKCO1_1400093 [Diplodia corticola]OJD36008.1 hypothetical protein BKCO1_1400093 [Diplodia corticola]